MSDARISTALPAHPKTKRLIRRLGPQAGWYLVCLFLWVAANRSDGDLTGMTSEDIELAVDWPGEEGAFYKALADVGFLDVDSGCRIHDWAEHNPWAAGAEARSEKSRFAALCKRHGRPEAARLMPEYAKRFGQAGTEHAEGTPSGCHNPEMAVPESASGMPAAETGSAPSPIPSPSPSPYQEQDQRRSSSAAPNDPPTKLDVKRQEREQRELRLAQVTDAAIAAYNGSELVKAKGGLLPSVCAVVGRDKRIQQVSRCIKIARQICEQRYGDGHITPQFWVDYFLEIDKDDFMAGRKGGGKGHEDWVPDFEFLTQPKQMLKVYERATSEGAAA